MGGLIPFSAWLPMAWYFHHTGLCSVSVVSTFASATAIEAAATPSAEAGGRAAALESGDVQLVGESGVPGPDIVRLAALPALALETRGYEYGSSIALVEFNLDRPAFKDVRVATSISRTTRPAPGRTPR